MGDSYTIYENKAAKGGQTTRTVDPELDRLSDKSARVLLDIKNVFLFDIFRDELILDETKVSIHTNIFFKTGTVRSIAYQDIFNVSLQQGLLFAKIEIFDRFFSQESISIEYLRRNEAMRAKNLIQGMMIALKENIDTHTMSLDELTQQLERIGESR